MTYAIERVDTFYIFCTASLFQCNSTPFYNEHNIMIVSSNFS